MQLIQTLLTTLFSIALMAAIAKLAARLYRKSVLTWKRAFLYVGLVVLCTVIMGTIGRAGGNSTPAVLAAAAGLALHVLPGGWYFGRYAQTSSGEMLGFPHGAILTLIFVGIGIVVFAVSGLALLLLGH